jgi:hypothetical protein
MKRVLAGLVVLAVAWIGMWAFDLGVLVHSASTVIPKTRECRYLVGISVLKRLEPLADRCPLVRKIGS